MKCYFYLQIVCENKVSCLKIKYYSTNRHRLDEVVIFIDYYNV